MSDADPITAKLRELQTPITRHLWTPADAITFTPCVLTKIYGDGRALFFIGTINSRPAYWIVRGCSTWQVADRSDYHAPRGAPDFAEFFDDIINALEEEFGWAECGVNYEWDGEKIIDLDQEARDGDALTYADISYPVVNHGGGCHWGRLDWPTEIGAPLVAHPFARGCLILADPLIEHNTLPGS